MFSTNIGFENFRTVIVDPPPALIKTFIKLLFKELLPAYTAFLSQFYPRLFLSSLENYINSDNPKDNRDKVIFGFVAP